MIWKGLEKKYVKRNRTVECLEKRVGRLALKYCIMIVIPLNIHSNSAYADQFSFGQNGKLKTSANTTGRQIFKVKRFNFDKSGMSVPSTTTETNKPQEISTENGKTKTGKSNSQCEGNLRKTFRFWSYLFSSWRIYSRHLLWEERIVLPPSA